MRDITLGETFYPFFTTRAFATGVPGTLSGTPVLSVLEENNITPITAGVSVQVDRASVVGLNQAPIVATGANGYEVGKSYAIYISTGTVGGSSVVGEVVGEFTIQASAAAVDLANATDGLSALKTLIDAVDDLVDTEVAAIKSDTAAILVDTAEIGVAGAGLTNINLPNQTMDIVGNITGSLSGSVGSVTAGVTLAASAVQAIWDALTSALVTAGSIGKLLVDRIDAAITSRMATYTQPAGFLAATFPPDPADQSLVIAATDAIITDTNDIQARLPAALTAGGNMKADMLALDGSTTSAARLRRSASVMHDGAVTGAATATTLIDSGLTHPDNDQLKGRIVIFDGNVTAGLREQATDITAFDAATDKLTFTALTQPPAAGDTYIIV